MDFYHVGVLHVKTFGAKFGWTDDNVHLKPGGGISIFYSAGPPTPNAEPLLGKMPWLEDRPVSFACTGFLSPNCTFFGRIDVQPLHDRVARRTRSLAHDHLPPLPRGVLRAARDSAKP